MTAGTVVLLVAVVLALGLGGARAARDGRFRGTRATGAAESEPVASSVWSSVAGATDVAPGERATLVQFSSAFCAPCRATRRILADVADIVPGVVHVEIDAEHHLDLVRELGIARTPTTLVLDASGAERTRAVGAPRKEQVLQALAAD